MSDRGQRARGQPGAKHEAGGIKRGDQADRLGRRAHRFETERCQHADQPAGDLQDHHGDDEDNHIACVRHRGAERHSAYLNLSVASSTVAPSLAWIESVTVPSGQLISSEPKFSLE